VGLLERKTARIILINEHSEVLLLKYVDKTPADPLRPTLVSYWVPPGGGLENGESFEEAARRELEEEIGDSIEIGAWVWSRQRKLLLNGERRLVSERYFVARVSSGRMTPLNRTHDNFVSHRWWTMNDLNETAEAILPPDLPMLIAPIIDGEYPQSPINVDVE
jgi:8-oxo-dGTP pyrophosphatase MutT (NUDIX family)